MRDFGTSGEDFIEEVQLMRLQSEELECSEAEHKRTGSRPYRISGFSHYIAAVLIFICLLNVSMAQFQTDQTRQILILNAYHKGFKWTDEEVAGAKEVLTKEIKNLELYTEYMDTKRIRSDEYIQLIRRTLQLKYDKVKLDAIVATDDNALSFLLKYHKELFGRTPVVFCGVNDFQDSMLKGKKNFTGLTEALEIKPTIDIALKLHPGTKKIVVISDGTPTGLGQRKTIIAVARQYEDLEFEYLNGEELSTAELLKKLRGLPPDSIALLATWMWDKTGAYVLSGDISSLCLVPSSSVVPVYGFTDMWLDSGIVGGKILNGRAHGYDAAKLVLRILNGEKPADIGVRAESDNPYVFDYNQLKRWQISMFDLPKGSIIINEPETFYYLYKTQIWAVVAIITALTAVVIILSASILRRKRAEEALRKSEESYRTLYESSQDGIATANLKGTIMGCNRAYADMLGYSREEIKKIRYQDITPSKWHALNEKIFQEVMERGYSDVFEKEYIRKDGTVFPVALRAWRIDDEDGNPVGVGSIVRDITERKRAQERIAKLNNCFLNFGPNPDENIKALTAITGELLGARCSLYNRLEGDMLCSRGQWNTPAGYNPKDRPEGHICYDVIQKGGDNVFLVRNLQNTLYAKTDPNVVPYKLQTYFGRVVKCGNAFVGSLCAVYQKDFIPDENDKKLIGILASAIGVEEERKKAEEALEGERGRLYSLLDGLPAFVYLQAPDHSVRFANRYFREHFGEPEGKMCYEVLWGAKEPCKLCPTFRVFDTKKPQVWEWSQSPDGRIYEINDYPFSDVDGSPLVLELGFDITKRKKAEAKLLDYQAQLKSLASELSLAEERERRRIATELHDRIGQSLVISKIKLDWLRESVSSKDADKVLGEICKTLGQTIQDTRSLTFDLSYPILYELGFETAVSEWLTEQIQKKNGIAAKFRDDGKPKPLDDEICVLLFRTVRELLINVVKHAQAQNVTVSTRKVNNEIQVCVEDDGVGFNPPEVGTMSDKIGGFGLFSIRERLEHLGGRIKIDSKAGKGCRVMVTAPLKRGKAASGAKE